MMVCLRHTKPPQRAPSSKKWVDLNFKIIKDGNELLEAAPGSPCQSYFKTKTKVAKAAFSLAGAKLGWSQFWTIG